ncbi:ABC transporter ATP-binding protein [Nocardioides ungokensis]|uniref:ABC transporter ATP-binding protein n=1 Tax=Nocardioides ungokensis TaxID=1643322 RepID=UPI0015DFBEBE|nr:ABC transporter ATP-binding protein [Nocardioides ungokensis]
MTQITSGAGPTAISLRGATKRFPTRSGEPFTALRDVDLDVAPGEFVSIVGPTGCGKSTTLSLVSGLEPASAGTVAVHGAPVTAIPDGVGYMFQADAVLPWKNVLDNVALGLRYRGAGKAEAHARARDWITRVGLAGFEDRYPHQLSGGMRKRVAMAQTLITEPSLLLLDEPFGALDVQTRELMQDELLRLWSGTGAACVFVTHDLTEAITLADRVVVMTAGPATVKDVVDIDLPRPRRVEEIRLTPEFIDLYKRVWDSLREEVEITRTRGASRVA